MLNVGDKVPDFTLPLAYADGRRESVAFTTFLGKGPIVIAFYPLAFSSTCTEEMCDLRDARAHLDTVKAQTFGFSIDSKFTNVAYAKAHALGYGIFCDANRTVVDEVWATMTVSGVESTAKRGWLIITADGIVAAKWVTDDADEWPGVSAIEAALLKLK